VLDSWVSVNRPWTSRLSPVVVMRDGDVVEFRFNG
jgi:hypothetical protein